jgi:hypothetical protein
MYSSKASAAVERWPVRGYRRLARRELSN